MTRVIHLRLPMPPTVNHMYWNLSSGGKVKTDEYRNFEEAAALALNGQSPLSGPVGLRFIFHFRTAAGDVDNRLKPAQDILQGCLFANDRQVVDVGGRRGSKAPDDPHMEVIAWELDGTPESFRPAIDYIVAYAIDCGVKIGYTLGTSNQKTAVRAAVSMPSGKEIP